MKAASSVLAAIAALILGTAFLLSAVGTHDKGDCGKADAAQVGVEAVAGYRGDQLINAATIMNTATGLGLDARAQLIGVMAAMGESSLRILTYGDFESAGVRNPDGSPTTSIGLFQQQDSWGTREQRLDAATSATLFYDRLVDVDGWESLAPTEAIHRVQVNSDPDHYTKWQDDAEEVVAALTVPCAESANYAAANGTKPGAWGGYSNGQIPREVLATVPWDDSILLRPDAVRALAQLNAAFRQAFGYDLPLNDGYRDYDGQLEAKALYGDGAAEPGQSNHGWALAIDIGTLNHTRIDYDSATYAWLTQHAGAYGWVHPDWAEPGGVGPHEAWHWEYYGVAPAGA